MSDLAGVLQEPVDVDGCGERDGCGGGEPGGLGGGASGLRSGDGQPPLPRHCQG